jgi:hypothetical protein
MGEGSIVRKTPDTALYSLYVSTLCAKHSGQIYARAGHAKEHFHEKRKFFLFQILGMLSAVLFYFALPS